MKPPQLPTCLRDEYRTAIVDGKCWKLNKALYGLKQGSRAWYEKLATILGEMGLVHSKYDPSLYASTIDGNRIYILVYVDDLLIFSDDMENLNSIKKQLPVHLEIRDLGPARWFLGIHIYRNFDTKSIKLSQEAYVERLLHRYNMENCKTKDSPMPQDSSIQMYLASLEKACNGQLAFRELIGSLMYLSMVTRPELCFVVSHLARYMH